MNRTRRKTKAWQGFKLGRNTGTRGEPKKRILIVCEGEKTEPNYFKAFRITSATVVVEGLGKHTVELVEKTIEIKEKARKDGKTFDRVWVVLDRDSFPATDFNQALKLASENRVEIAYSNECFEIWYLLHYSFFQSAVPRKTYGERLTKKLGKQYRKNSKTIYDELLQLQPKAIQYSKKLFNSYSPINPEKNNPSTTVFKLVEELNKNK